MKKCKILASLFFILLFVTSVQAQLFSISGQLGYARPQGSVFKDKVTGEKLGSLGIGYDFDVLMGLDRFDNKLSVGIMYDGNALFGFQSSTEFDFGMYGLAMYGVKGHYRLLSPDRKVSPYASLGLGLSQFGTPDVYSGDSLVVSGKSIYSLAVRPEIGFDLGGLQLSVAYFVPMHYKVESATGNFSGTAGVLSFSLGWRQYISFGGSSIKTKEGKKNVAQSLKSKALGKIGVSINDNSDNVEITQDGEKTSAANNNATKKAKKVENANAKSSAERKENVSKDEVDVSEETIVETATPVSTQSQKTETQEYSTTSVSVQGKTLTPQRIPQTNAEAVRPSASSSDEHVTFSNPNFKVGETVFYKMRDRMYSAKIISFKGSNIAVVEMENGATVERYLKDLVKAK
ncbi:MAG: hypothetical protein J6X43_08695 [Bacteroidales bacterium]|nr:hypothetical protein [Bacteroidales bacterium]